MPELRMLVGLPASGKTDYCEHLPSLYLIDAVVISSDKIRKELYGDEGCQDSPGKVFETMNRRTIQALSDGRNVVYDATNILRKHRKHLLSTIPKQIQCEKRAVVVWARYETCIERDKQRARHVGEDVIRRMYLQFQMPFYDEGWDKIEFDFRDALYTVEEIHSELDCPHDNPHPTNMIIQHTANVVRQAYKHFKDKEWSCPENYKTALYYAAYYHDIGKKFTKQFKDSKGNETPIAHYYNHHNVGAWMTIGSMELFDKFKRDDYTMAMICWLVNVHMEPFFDTKYYRNMESGLKQLVDIFHECDIKGA